MVSSFGWLALDNEHRRRMLETVDQFRDQSTIDDLGLGAIRDAFSDTLFPGTSTLHTRLRYVLFIPWLLQEASHKRGVSEMGAAFRDYELDLIGALLRGESTNGALGVMGSTAGRSLKRLPSAVYWGALTTWGIFQRGFSVRSFFERALLRREELRIAPRSDDSEFRIELTSTGIDERIPNPPDHLLRRADFTLREEDARYLSETITRTTAGSLLAHLITHRPPEWIDADSSPSGIGDAVIRDRLPTELDAVVDRAERFATVAQGVNLFYNLMLAEVTGRQNAHGNDLVDVYRMSIRDWFAEASGAEPLGGTDMAKIWRMMAGQKRRVSRQTREFVETWSNTLTSAQSAEDILTSDGMRSLVRHREHSKKGRRARLAPGNQRALDAWNGASGTDRYTYRWAYARRHLQDLYEAGAA